LSRSLRFTGDLGLFSLGKRLTLREVPESWRVDASCRVEKT
jgi:hypothetical protein